MAISPFNNSSISINNKKELELMFANDFSTPYFPVLAEIYMQGGDIKRAKLVCDIGLQNAPENNCGKFLLAKIALIEEKTLIAEKWLKQVVIENPLNFNALRMLIRIEMLLNRSPKTIIPYIKRILDYIPNDFESTEALNIMYNTSNVRPRKDNNLKKQKNKPNTAYTKNNKKIFLIKPTMATLSMVKILKNQKHYLQALEIIKILESKKSDTKELQQEKEDI